MGTSKKQLHVQSRLQVHILDIFKLPLNLLQIVKAGNLLYKKKKNHCTYELLTPIYPILYLIAVENRD